jgi:hypothetical protein
MIGVPQKITTRFWQSVAQFSFLMAKISNLPKWRQLSKMAPSAICLKRELLQLCFEEAQTIWQILATK